MKENNNFPSRIYFILATAILLTSCKKDSEADPAVQNDSYVGLYTVSEDARIISDDSFNQHYDFIGEIIEGDSTDRIKVVQSMRTPSPAWAGWSADTIEYKIYAKTDSLKTPFVSTAKGKIYKPDTLRFRYLYGAGVLYDVRQTWVRKRQ